MATFTVNNANDSSVGSLRNAITNASTGDSITFSLPPNTTITLTSGEISIPPGKNLLIDGAGATNLSISGNNNSRIFNLNSTSVQPTSLEVRGLTLANGNAGNGRGGAISTTGELHTLIISNVTFSNNSAGEGGAIYSVFRGALTVANSRFIGNSGVATNSEQGAGAIFFLGPNQLSVNNSLFEDNRGINGGAINNLAGRVTIENSTFRNNNVLAARFATGQSNDFLRGYGGALYSDRVSPANDPTGGTYRIINSTFEDNQGRAAGGALYLFTGTLDALEIENSSFLNNRTIGLINSSGNPQGEAGNGGALELQSDTVNRGLTIAGSTFAGNRSVDRGGAIRSRNFPGNFFNNTFDNNRTTLPGSTNFTGGLGGALELGGGTGVQVNVRNNTFSNNFATWTGGAILAGVTLRSDNNIFDRNSTNTFNNGNPILSHVDGSTLSGSNNLQNPNNRGQTNNQAIPGGTITSDPLLSPLASNGGLTQTRALQSSSPAINAGNNSQISPDTFDFDLDGNVAESVPFDQRGAGFDRIIGGTVDVGAFEFNPVIQVTNLDVDGSGRVDALTDGILTIRFLFGLTGTALTNGALGAGATRTTGTEITNYLTPARNTMLDVDGNGSADALTDGILTIRFMFGLTGNTLTNGAIGAGATRTSPSDVLNFLQSFQLPGASLVTGSSSILV